MANTEELDFVDPEARIPEIQAVQALERADGDYWKLISEIGTRATLFANSLRDAHALTGYNNHHESMSWGFYLPDKKPTLLDPPLERADHWQIAEARDLAGDEYWSWGADTEITHPLIKSTLFPFIGIGGQGEILKGFGNAEVPRAVRRKAPLPKKSESRTVVFSMQRFGHDVARFIVDPEKVGTEEARQGALSQWEMLIQKKYKSTVSELERKVERLPQILRQLPKVD